MNIVYQIKFEWQMGYPGSDDSYSEIIPLFNKSDEEVSHRAIMNSIKNARVFDDSYSCEISSGYRCDFSVKLQPKDDDGYGREIYVNVHLFPLLEKDGLYFELTQVDI